jgi:site-specific recombinase XerD
MNSLEVLLKYKEYLKANGLAFTYYNFLKVFFDYLNENKVEVENITQEVITKFFNANEYSANSKNNFLKAGRHFWAFYFKGIDCPFLNLQYTKVDRRIPNYLTEKDLDKVIKYVGSVATSMSPLKVNAVLSFMFYTGLRLGELLTLQRKDFKLEENSVKVIGHKEKREKVVLYTDQVKELLEGYFKEEVEEINAFNLTRDRLMTLFDHMQDIFPDKKLSPHKFRHSFAKHLINKGVDISIVSKLLGHSSLQTTMIYVDPDEEMMKDIYKKKVG